MRKFYAAVFSLFFFAVSGIGQTTITINCTGNSGSYNSGSVTYSRFFGGTKTPGNLSIASGGANGWTTFDLSSIPAGATINSVTINFTVFSSSTPSSVNNGLYGFTGDPSAMNANTLYNNCQSGNSFSNAVWSINQLNTFTFNSDGISFIQSNVGSKCNIGFVREGTATYNIYGYPGTSSQEPKLIINYTPPCTAPVITSPPSNTSICAGPGASFSVTATGTSLTYQWQVNTGSGFADIPNGGVYGTSPKTATLSISNATAGMSGYQYRCVVSSGSCSTNSGIGTLTVNAPTASAGSQNPAICQGGTTSGLSGTVGGTATGGTWSSSAGGTFSPDATTPTATWTPPAGYSGTATLTLTTSGGTCGVASDSKSQVVNPTLVSGSIGGDKTICYNTSAGTLSNAASPTGGSGTYVYQWQSSSNGTSWSNVGTNSATYSPGNLTSTTYFRRNVTSGPCASVSSNTVIVTVNPQLVAGTVGSDQSICYNTTPDAFISNTLPTGGTGSFTYQWQSSSTGTGGWSNIGGATSVTYAPGVLTTTTYYRRAETSGSCGTVYTTNIKVTVYGNLTAGSIGSAQTICYNASPATFTNVTSPTGGPGGYTYQWQSSPDNSTWTDIGSANSATYASGALTSTTYFRRNVTSGSCGTVSTSSIKVTVNPQLVSGTVGSDQTICYNSSPASLTNVTSPSGGTGSYTYQWQSSPNGTSSWTNVGGNSATYAPGNLTVTTYYRRNETSGACGTVTSNVVTVTVNPNLIAGTVGADQSICYNTLPEAFISNSLPSGGTGTYTYQWQSSPNGSSSWTNIGGATLSTYDVSSPLTSTTYYRRAETSEACGTVYSNNIKVTVYGNLTPGTASSNQTICYNTAPAAFSVTAPTGGPGGYTYQWQSSPDNSTWTDIGGANSATYTSGSLTSTTYFRRNVTSGSCGTVSSNVITITVNGELLPGSIGSDQEICANTAPSQLVNSNAPTGGTGSYTYQWQSSVDNTTWTNVASGGTAINYSPGNLNVTTYFKRNETSGSCGTVSSNIIKITVNPLPTATISGSTTVCQNSAQPNITFTGDNGAAPYTFTYTVTGTPGTQTITASGNSVDLPVPTGTKGAFTYTLVSVQDASSTACTQNQTGSAVVTVKEPPAITVEPIDQTTCATAFNVTFTVTATGDNLSYQWYKEGNPIPLTDGGNLSGTDTKTLTFDYTTTADNGKYYVVVTGDASCVTPAESRHALLTVYEDVQITTPPVAQAVCTGTDAIFQVAATGPVGMTYKWYKGASELTDVPGHISGSGTETLTIAGATATDVANYIVKINIPGGAHCTQAQSLPVKLVVNPIPAVNAVSNKTVCNGASSGAINFSTSVPGTVYNWTSDNTSIGIAASGTGNIASFVATNSGTAPVTATVTVTPSYTNSGSPSTTCTGAPITFQITVNPTPSINAVVAQSTICSNTATSIDLSSNVDGATYSWTVVQTGVTGASSGSGESIAQILKTTGTSQGKAVYTITSSANGCNSSSTIVTINVNPLPNVTVNPLTQTICSDGTTSIALTSNIPGATFDWTVVETNVTGATPDNGTSIAQTLSTTGTASGTAVYTITPSVNGCSGTSGTASVTVNPRPVITATPASTTICSGKATNISLSSNISPSDISWIVLNQTGVSGASNGTGSNISQTLTTTGNSPGTVTYQITASTASSCNSDPVNVTITVNPNVIISPLTQTVCSGTSINTINVTSDVAGTITHWERTNPAGITTSLPLNGSGPINGSIINNNANSVNVVFTITGQSTTGSCQSITTATVTVYSSQITAPAISTDQNQTVCVNSTPAPLTATASSGVDGNISYQWQISPDNINWTDIPGKTGLTYQALPVDRNTDNEYYRVVATSNTCGTVLAQASNSIEIQPGNKFGVSWTIGGNVPTLAVCPGVATYDYTISGLVFGGIKFDFNADPNYINPPSQTQGGIIYNSADFSFTTKNEGNTQVTTTVSIVPTFYTLTWSGIQTCSGSPVTFDVKILPKAKAGSITGPDALCIGVPTTYTSDGNTGGAWSSSNTAVATINAATGAITTLTAGTTNITYTVSSGCASPVSVSKTITVNPNVTAGTVSGATSLCKGVTSNFTQTGGTSGGTWSSSKPSVATVNSSTGVVTTVNAGSTDIIYTVNSGCASPVSSKLTLTVNPDVTAGVVTGSPNSICINEQTQYFSSGTPGGSWSSDDEAIATVDASGKVTGKGQGTTNIRYSVAPTGCNPNPASSVLAVTVKPDVVSGTVSGMESICIGETTTYSSQDGTPGGTWSSNNTAVATVNSATGLVKGISAGQATISYTVTGCNAPAAATKIITVKPDANPGTLIASGSTTLCIGETVTFTSNGDAGAWSSSDITIASVDPATGEVTAVGAGTANIIYTVSTGCNQPKSAAASVTVNPNATAGIITGGDNPSYCVGGLVDLSTTGDAGGTWSSSDETIATVNSSGHVEGVAPGTVTITYTVTSGCNFETAVPAAKSLKFINASAAAKPNMPQGPAGSICANADGNSFTVDAVTDANAYVWSLPSGWSITSPNTQAQTITVKTNLNSGNVSVLVYTACGAGPSSDPLPVKLHNVWTGTTSTDWNTASNWADGQVADAGCGDVYIPSTTKQPTLGSGTAAVGNLHILSGAALTVNNATMQIAGVIDNLGTFDASEGTLDFNGTTPQTIKGTMFENKTIENLKVSNDALTISNTGDTLNITGLVSFGTGTAKLNTGNNLTLKSTKDNTASIGTLGTGNAVNGQVEVERYINIGAPATTGTHGKTWQFLATPTQGQTFVQSWMENKTPGIVGYGAQFTGTSGTSGYDGISVAPSVKSWDPGIGNWKELSSTNNPLFDTTGYFAFVRGDRSVSTASQPANPTTLRSKGTILTGDQSRTAPVQTPDNVFFSIGNPYPSAVDMTKVLSKVGSVTEPLQFFYVWNPNGSDGYYNVGRWDSYTYIGGQYITTPGGQVNNMIQSGQAFLMQVDQSNPTKVTFTESAKSPLSSNIAFREQTVSGTSAQLITNLLSVKADGSTQLTDGTLQLFGKGFKAGIDRYDARKITNSANNFAVKSNGINLIVERRAPLTEQDTIQYNLASMAKQNFRLEFRAQGLSSEGVEGFVEDTYLDTRTPLNMEGTTHVDFAVTSDKGSYAANRFRIVFKTAVVLPVKFVSVTAAQKEENIQVDWKVENEQAVKQYDVEKSVDGVSYKKAYTVAAANNGAVSYDWPDEQANPGDNYYRIRMEEQSGKVTYSNVVKVSIPLGKPSIGIYPNPITDGIIHLQLVNQPKGRYGLRLLNPLGQTIIAKQVEHAGGNATENIKWDYNLAHGVYQLQILKPDGKIQVIKVMY